MATLNKQIRLRYNGIPHSQSRSEFPSLHQHWEVPLEVRTFSLKHDLVTNWNYLPYNPNGGVASIAKVVACDWNCFPVVFISPAGIVSKMQDDKNINRKKHRIVPPPIPKILPKSVLVLYFFRFFWKN